jgi:phosphatidylserine/phosphatidylglycerophosphate/cardiolipin synthase-like enzyme
LNPKSFVHCHNKLVVVDERAVLVGSQNWSDFAVAANREASVLIPHADVAAYFASIFKSDWDSALRQLPAPPPRGAVALMRPTVQGRGRKVVPLNWGDYVQV